MHCWELKPNALQAETTTLIDILKASAADEDTAGCNGQAIQ